MRYLIVNENILQFSGAPKITFIEARSPRDAAEKYINRFFTEPNKKDFGKYYSNVNIKDYKLYLANTLLDEGIVVDADTIDTVM